MTVFLITYDLNKPGQDYDKILKVIKSYDFTMLCESSYLVETDDVGTLTKDIYTSFDKSTDAYIFPIENPIYFDFGSKKCSDWLENHLPKPQPR
jgi:hypothetical protein